MKSKLALIITLCAFVDLLAKGIAPVPMAAYEASATQKLKENPVVDAKEASIRVTVAWGYHPTLRVFDEREMDVPSGSTVAEVAALWQKEMRTSLFAPVYGNVVVLRKNAGGVDRVAWSVNEARFSGPKFVLKNGDVLISVGSEVY
ncbi:MAG: hypothetical protein ABIZ81_01545 [Opitutaceae bacterium]